MGGTTYNRLNLLSPYLILSVPTPTTFTAAQIVNGARGPAVEAGNAGTGTTSVGYLTKAGDAQTLSASQSIFGVMSGEYTKWQNMTANLFSPAPASGVPSVRWYEGALEPSAPTITQCSNIGIKATDCATLATALLAWKNNPIASATIQYYYQTFKGMASGTITFGAMLNSKAPSQLVMQGGGLYGLNSNAAYESPSPYQLYYGFQAFSHP